MNDKLLHFLMMLAVLAAGIILILFAHQYIDPIAVYTGTVSGIAGLVGVRIAANGYLSLSSSNNSQAIQAVTYPQPILVQSAAPATTTPAPVTQVMPGVTPPRSAAG